MPFSLGSARLHHIIQGIFLAFMLIVGVQFTIFALWAMGVTDFFLPRPAAVEAFLPISALLALKRFLLTGVYDDIHPAGLTILILALALAFFARKSFCGLLCPIGTISRLLFHLGKKYDIRCTPPRWLALLLLLPKYALLFFFVQILLVSMDAAAINAFLHSPYNMVADSKMLLFFLPPSPTTIVVLLFLLCGGLIIPSFWCRCFCPYGALLGIVSLFSPLAVRRDAAICTHCGKCTKACPAGIDVSKKLRVASPECTGCLECINACPQKNCLSLNFGYTKKHSRRLSWWSLAALTLGILALLYGIAQISGHWQSSIPQDILRPLHENIRALQHF